MRFDSNQAWQRAVASVAASRDVLWAVAGVFILLPSLAFSLLFPQPEPAVDASPEQMMATMQAFYVDALPWFLPVALLQGVGTLALLALLTDRRRPTVGEAIRSGAFGLVSYIGAQLLLGMAIGLAAALFVGVAAASGSGPFAAIMVVLVGAVAIYVAVRTSLVAPVIVVEGVASPVAALRRSWALTEGQAGRIGLFFLLLFVVAGVLLLIVGGLFGVLAALVAGEKCGMVLNALVSAALGAGFSLYFVAVLAAVHRQLAGGDPGEAARTFE